ncbi:hypothetical protein [Paenibacillus allorhizoplanae]|nr:hypothetical protein [Paenibacillus allorhizoplanae]
MSSTVSYLIRHRLAALLYALNKLHTITKPVLSRMGFFYFGEREWFKHG